MDESKAAERKELENPDFQYVTLKGVFATREDGHLETGMKFSWGAKNIGWGEFRISMDSEKGLRCWSEYCGKEFVRKALLYWIEQTKIVE